MWDPWADTRACEELRVRLKWFLLGRVAVISCFLGMVAFSYLRSGEERYVISVNRLLLAVALTYAFSAVSALVLPRSRRLDLFTHVQVAFDVLLISGVVFLTGGIGSPFAFLYSLPIVNSAGLLFSGGALLSALLSALAYDGLMAVLASGAAVAPSALPPAELDLQVGLRLVTMNLTFFLIAYLAGILTRRLHAAELLLKERQAEREHMAALQNTLAQTIGSGLLTTDPDGRVTSVDETARRVGGVGDDIVGKDVGSIFPPLRLAPTARLRLLQSSGGLEPIEFVHQRGDGESSHLRCVVAPLKDTYGRSFGALYVVQDVTRLKEVEKRDSSPTDIEDLCRDDLDEATEVTDGLYGVSAAIRRIRDNIARVAPSDATVLIGGESGTGKEVVARSIHARGPRRDKPFVAINCGAIPEHLIESELFGHVRGAFTGAVADRPGCFRSADGGTVFLDEIGELPLHLQVKLLRVLQERVFRPVGSETSIAVNVRIIAASNRDLHAQMQSGRFREDLYYRLNVIAMDLPPLRERREDIPLLVRHFLREFSELHGRRVSRFSVAAGRLLLKHDYPGNVRELENLVEHAVALCDGETATEEHLPPYLSNGHARASDHAPALSDVVGPGPETWARPDGPVPVSADLDRDLAEYEKAILLGALDRAGGVKKRAAELLGINYRSLRHRLQKYGLGDVGESPPAVQ
jgi:PAS domain S-box-containing protein